MATKTATRDITISREFDAPRELVWKAWTEPERVACWWGPQGFTAPDIKMDVRVGGRFHWCMRSPEGEDHWMTGFFREIAPPGRLVLTVVAPEADADGACYGTDDDVPASADITVTLEDLGGSRTRLTFVFAGQPVGEHTDQSEEGWNEIFDKLAASLK
jgi:uncharacterized protein YndB with AHSA1/START domain